MLILRSVLLSGFAALAFSAVHAQQPPLTEQQAASGQFVRPDQGEVIKPKAEPHFAAALAAAGETIKGPLLLCNAARPQGLKLAIPSVKVLRAEDVLQGKPPGPARIFDNFYYVGAPNVTAFAVNTPDGIILIDSLNNKGEAQSIIEAGLRKFGLDPARIKYVVVTHGHGDHYGGSAYFAKTYGARILMSDTATLHNPGSYAGHRLGADSGDGPWRSPSGGALGRDRFQFPALTGPLHALCKFCAAV